MKKVTLMASALLMGMMLTFISCSEQTQDSAEDTVENAGDDVENAADKMGQDFEQGRSNLRDEINGGVDKLDKKIEEADAEIIKATANEKDRWKKRKAVLEEERNDLKTSLDNLGDRTEANWKEFKSDVNRKMEKIEADLEN